MLPPRIDAQAVTDKIGPYADPRATIEERAAIYQELLGFVPPRIEARLAVTGALDPDLLDLQERLRAHAMYPRCFDVKTAQLMLFGMLLMDLSDAAQLHALAARRAGATWEELQATVSLCFLFRGLSAANRGAEILANLAKREREADPAALHPSAPSAAGE
jgi:alkylhydroperoxidase/carboxymuconolactone decarboxylase family protein YurZ